MEGRTITGLVHIAVCIIFNGMRHSVEHTVDHIDRNKSNNDASNLRWANAREQLQNRSN